MFFRDRIDAATRLADALSQLRGTHPLVVAIPRGAVPMGRLIAQRLDGELDVVLVRKLRRPGQPGVRSRRRRRERLDLLLRVRRGGGRFPAYLEREVAEQMTTIRRRGARSTRRRDPRSTPGVAW